MNKISLKEQLYFLHYIGLRESIRYQKENALLLESNDIFLEQETERVYSLFYNFLREVVKETPQKQKTFQKICRNLQKVKKETLLLSQLMEKDFFFVLYDSFYQETVEIFA